MSLLLFLALIAFDGKVTVRLLDSVSTVHSKVGDHVRAVMVSPPTGVQVEGILTDIKRIEGKQKRAELRIEFQKPGAVVAVREVDNARETVSSDGRIVGMPLFRARPSKAEDALLLAAHAHPVMLGLFTAGEITRREADKPEINYPAGIELIIQWNGSIPDGTVAQPGSLPGGPEITVLAQRLPSRTSAHNGTLSDFTNLLFIGEADDLQNVFLRAGWLPAEHLSLKAIGESFFALAERHSYKEAPVSALYIQGRLPDLVFQKQNNTLAKRHHVRLWRQSLTFVGRPVWLGAATHDIGLEFSRKAKRFTHRIDQYIDSERQKIIDDLIFAEGLSAAGIIQRLDVPNSGQNATGDNIHTDGAIAVLLLR